MVEHSQFIHAAPDYSSFSYPISLSSNLAQVPQTWLAEGGQQVQHLPIEGILSHQRSSHIDYSSSVVEAKDEDSSEANALLAQRLALMQHQQQQHHQLDPNYL